MSCRMPRRLWPAAAMLVASASLAAAEEPSMCTDRPTKANAVCTVPAGKIQIETDAVNWTRTRSGGTRTDLILYTNPTLKLGLGPNTDIEANLAPHIESRTRTSAGVSTVRGPGDLFLRVKQRVTDPDGKVQLGLIPFVKLPTARRGIGNGEWEGGLAVPIQFSLSPKTSLTLGPELDLLADGDGQGRHVQLVGLVNIGRTGFASPHLVWGVVDGPELRSGGHGAPIFARRRGCLSPLAEAADRRGPEPRPQQGDSRPPALRRSFHPILTRDDSATDAGSGGGGRLRRPATTGEPVPNLSGEGPA